MLSWFGLVCVVYVMYVRHVYDDRQTRFCLFLQLPLNLLDGTHAQHNHLFGKLATVGLLCSHPNKTAGYPPRVGSDMLRCRVLDT